MATSKPLSMAALRGLHPRLIGVDFTSAPGRRKPILAAHGELVDGQLLVGRLQKLVNFDSFEQLLAEPGPWVAGFDMPFGLPRELVEHLQWPLDWVDCIRHYAGHSREQLRTTFKEFCDARAPGNKFAHRRTDRPAGSSASMKWVNPPVAWMLHAGAIRLIDAQVSIPGLHIADPHRLALEAYPGMLARSVTKVSYKSDTKAKQTPDRRDQRESIVSAVVAGRCRCGIETRMSRAIRQQLIDDGSGDALDAVLCLVQTAWALNQPHNFGLPADIDQLEGWIVGA